MLWCIACDRVVPMTVLIMFLSGLQISTFLRESLVLPAEPRTGSCIVDGQMAAILIRADSLRCSVLVQVITVCPSMLQVVVSGSRTMVTWEVITMTWLWDLASVGIYVVAMCYVLTRPTLSRWHSLVLGVNLVGVGLLALVPPTRTLRLLSSLTVPLILVIMELPLATL